MITRKVFWEVNFKKVNAFKVWNDEPVSLTMKINKELRNFWQFEIPKARPYSKNFCIPTSCVADSIECVGMSAVCSKPDDVYRFEVNRAGTSVE